MATLGDNIKGKKGHIEYQCDLCDFKCCKKYSWERHLTTYKHTKAIKGDKLRVKKGKKVQTNEFVCDYCNKHYLCRQSLWKHLKKGQYNEENNTKIQEEGKENKANKIAKEDLNDNELIKILIKENAELKKEQSDIKDLIFKEHSYLKEIILEIVKNEITNTNNNHSFNTTNSHNKAFNLLFFLNDTCKNAINLT